MNVYKVGLDIGSTTTKMVVLDKDGTTVLFSGYKRHQAKIQECLLGFLYLSTLRALLEWEFQRNALCRLCKRL